MLLPSIYFGSDMDFAKPIGMGYFKTFLYTMFNMILIFSILITVFNRNFFGEVSCF